ncbi:MAG: hypothetical protein O7C75_01540 [Verrucomicrobia bacterium]|nr:hypothetical protein [Verrucomicrobiota bacterium]
MAISFIYKLPIMVVDFLSEVNDETRKVGSKGEVYENAKPL